MMAAYRSSKNDHVLVSVTSVAYFLIVVVAMPAVVGGRPVVVAETEDICPEESFVYLMNTVCFEPARYDEPFHIVSEAAEAPTGGLEPRSSSGYLGFTGEASERGAKYAVRPETGGGEFIKLETPVVIYNTENGRVLGWELWGTAPTLVETSATGEYIEGQVQAVPAVFTFVKAQNVSDNLPCIKLWGARCEAYYLLSSPFPSVAAPSGWLWRFSAWHRGVFIFPAPAGSVGQVPLVLLWTSTTHDDVRIHIRSLT